MILNYVSLYSSKPKLILNMKHLLLLLILILCSLQNLSAQNQHTNGHDYQELQKRFDHMGNRGYTPKVLIHMGNFHLTSYEAKQLAATLRTDEEKGDFLYQIFPQIIDPENYIEVVDVFRRFSAALRLYHYTLGAYAPHQQQYHTPTCYPPQYHYEPDLVYDQLLCEMPDNAFEKFLTTLENATFSETQMNIIKSHINKTCFSTDQISDIMEVFSSDQDRVDVATDLYTDCLDPDNYFMLLDNLSFSSSKDQLSKFISSH